MCTAPCFPQELIYNKGMDTTPNITVSDSAVQRIAHLLKDEPAGTYFRIAVEGGGCSGFQYRFDFDASTLNDEDMAIEKEGAKVVIDETSHELVSGSELDFSQELVGSAFALKNPNAASGCGCGNSFAV